MTVSLTKEEERMLSGEYGPGVQKSMKLLVKVGDAYGADKMIEPKGAHLISWEALPIVGGGLIKMISELTEGSKVRIPTTANPFPINLEIAEEIGIPDIIVKTFEYPIRKVREIHKRIGVIPTSYSCHPHSLWSAKKGDYFAGTETAVTTFANSWLGIRSNIEGHTTTTAAAITGKLPNYGVHFSGNRYAKVLVEFESNLDTRKFTYADYGVLAYYVGKRLGDDRIPVFNGLPENMTADHAKYMSVPFIMGCSSPMFHIVGVTPEAPTLEDALGGEKPEERIVVGKDDMKESFEEISPNHSGAEIGHVTFGCAHCGIDEIEKIAELIKGKKVHEGVELWVNTNELAKEEAKSRGYVDMIESAGGFVITGSCAWLAPTAMMALRGFRGLATTSPAAAAMIERGFGLSYHTPLNVCLGSTEQCIKAAITGRWE